MPDDTYARGIALRKEVHGDEHVERSRSNATALDVDFQRLLTEVVWGTIWARPGLDRHTRHLLTLAMLGALGRHEELALHVASTRRTGVTIDELREVFLMVAVYAGVPAANSAFAIAKRVLDERDPERAPQP
jgi:4-carboxymuconolactone decarboxylase